MNGSAQRPKSAPTRQPTLALTVFTGLTATVSGAMFVARPDGALLNAPRWLLAHSPFHDFLVPGLLLLVVVGLGNVGAAWLTARRHDFAPFASFAAGCALLGWITVEMVMVRPFSFLQVIYLATALGTIGDSVRRLRKRLRDVGSTNDEEKATRSSPHAAR